MLVVVLLPELLDLHVHFRVSSWDAHRDSEGACECDGDAGVLDWLFVVIAHGE